MMSSDAQAVAAPLVKSVIFVVATMMVLVLIGFELSGGGWFTDTTRYSAIFTDTSGLRSGDSVRIAGVKVGKIHSVDVHNNTQGIVSFDVDTDAERRLPDGVQASARYLNLTGDRYLELEEGPGSGAPLPAGATIPIDRTHPALDLDVLLAGFNPLFEGLAPDKINDLSQEVISIFQGQGGTIENLLARAASLTGTIADKDAVIGQVVTNLNTVLGTLDKRSPELSQTIEQVQKLATGLAGDKDRLGQSFGDIDRLVSGADDLLGKIRGPLRGTVDQVARVGKQVQAGRAAVDWNLSQLPGAYLRVSRLGSRGSNYNLFICSVRLRLTGPDGQPLYTPWVGPSDNVDRCKPDIAPLEQPAQREQNDPVAAPAPGADEGVAPR